MNGIHHLLEQLQDTDAATSRFESLAEANPTDSLHAINLRAVKKRRADLERRLNTELKGTQSDLVQYHVKKTDDNHYPVLAVAKAILGFQELVTAVFDALRTAPKKKYRPSADNIALSTLDLAMALPVGSVLISMSIENDRLLAVKSELDETFDRVFEILRTKDSEKLRALADSVGVASISKAHAWAESTTQFGLSTKISIQKDVGGESTEFVISNVEAQSLKEAIEEKSDREIDYEIVVGELFGIDVDANPDRSYFHIKIPDGRNLEGKLAETFPRGQHWAVNVIYTANLAKVTTIKYATGEEKVEWVLSNLAPVSPSPTLQGMTGPVAPRQT